MHLSFDLISDLHLETWEDAPNWKDLATSLYCVVAGDISRDILLTIKTLTELSKVYHAVIYIDGNDEHRFHYHELIDNKRKLEKELAKIERVIYLQSNVAVIDNTAFIGCNGWWTYDFGDTEETAESKEWLANRYNITFEDINSIEAMALTDATYLNKSISKLQTHNEINNVVIVSHTVPHLDLVRHDIELENTLRLNCLGNRYLYNSIKTDTEAKIHTWVFGHYHNDVDQTLDGIRFVNNCRGRGDTPWCKPVYYPKKIFIN